MADELDDRDLKSTLNAWRESAEKQAERSDWFWARQRALVSSRVQQPAIKRVPALAWAGMAATVAIAIALALPGAKPANPNHGNTTQLTVQAQISDHELMQQLQETMNSSMPEALQPASTLEQEMEQAYSPNTTSTVKERMQ